MIKNYKYLLYRVIKYEYFKKKIQVFCIDYYLFGVQIT
jgi:hypothetical protein